MSAAVASIGIGALGLYQGYQAGKQAEGALGQQAAAAQGQLGISQQQMDLAKEQWNLYKGEIYPMEIESQRMGLDYQKIGLEQYRDYYAPMEEQFATEAMEGVEAQPERAAREARLSVDQAFDTEEGMMQRNLERRGVRPGSGTYESGIADTSLSRAAAKGFTVNRAIEAERDRAEDINFNRMATALGRTPVVSGGAPGLSSNAPAYGMSAAGQTAQGAGRQFGNIAGTYGTAAGDIASGGIQLGMQAYDTYNKYAGPSGGGYNAPSANFAPTSFNSYQAPPATGGGMDVGFSPVAFAEGGPVNAPTALTRGYAEGGKVSDPKEDEESMAVELAKENPGLFGFGARTLGRREEQLREQERKAKGFADGGQVNGPPGYDQVPAYIESQDGSRYPAKLTDDEYVIPADVVHVIGTGPLDDIIEKARNRKQQATQSPNALTRRMQ